MKNIILSFIFALICSATMANEPTLILNSLNSPSLPRNFRMTATPIEYENTQGLDTLNASASGQFSEQGLKGMIEIIPGSNIVIIDLRQETHGFINGMAVSWSTDRNWGNQGKTVDEIENEQYQRLHELEQGKATDIIINEKPVKIRVKSVLTEEELVTSYGLGYFHLPVTDHVRPKDSDVDLFLEYLQTIPENTWLHFHCSAGKGRASTFLTMYDMINNARDATVEDIFKRQHILGGKDFITEPQQSWKYELALERIAFLNRFYMYCRDSNFDTSWTDWESIDN